MNIAFIEPHIAVCGGIRRVIEFSNRLTDLGHTVSWFIPDWVYESRQVGGWMEQKFSVFPVSGAGDAHMRYDVVVFNEETQWHIARVFPASVRVYYALHWAVLHKDYNMLRNCYNGGFRIMTNSNWTADAMMLETAVRPEIVYGGINTNLFHPVNLPKTYDILTYGASRAWKGTDLSRAVFENLRREDPDVAMTMFGDNSGIPQDHLADAYGSARVYFSPSWYEGWNWPGLEAMACGTPVVISDDGGSRDYVKDGYNALVFPARDIEKATEFVKRVLSDDGLARKLSENGLETASRFTWEPEVKKMEKLFETWLYERTKSTTSSDAK